MQIANRLREVRRSSNEREEEIARLSQALELFDTLRPREGEEDEILSQIQRLTNTEDLRRHVGASKETRTRMGLLTSLGGRWIACALRHVLIIL